MSSFLLRFLLLALLLHKLKALVEVVFEVKALMITPGANVTNPELTTQNIAPDRGLSK